MEQAFFYLLKRRNDSMKNYFRFIFKNIAFGFAFGSLTMCTQAGKETSKTASKNDNSKLESNTLDLATAKVLTDEVSLKAGGEIYKNLCSACHGQAGEGLVGPNFTDSFWKHGGEFTDLCKVIVEGVPEKGMISWTGQLSGEKIAQVASYILSLEGSTPPNQKAAEGEKYERKEKIAFAIRPTNVVATDIPKIAMGGNKEKGSVLYNASLGCGHCHGPDGVGHVDNRNLKALKTRYKNEAKKIFDMAIHLGRTGTAMPPWAHISMTQKEDLKAYIFSIQD
jgi:mono/diheme cytochrome c family protein